MKKLFVLLAAIAMMGMPQSAMSQQRKNVQRKTTTKVKKKVTPQAVAPVEVTDPIVVDGCLAYMGVPVNGTNAQITEALKAKGFVMDSGSGMEQLVGTSYGAKAYLWINDEEHLVMATDVKTYKRAQAKRRVDSLIAGFLKVYNCIVLKYDLGGEDGGIGNELEGENGSIIVYYRDADEVEFSGQDFVVTCCFTSKKK